MKRISAEELVGEEWEEGYSMTPIARWRESAKLWEVYLSLGGSLDPEPLHKVLSSIEKHRVRALLMGRQACVLYGAAELSRDIDLAIVAGPANLSGLRATLADLKTDVIAVPPVDRS